MKMPWIVFALVAAMATPSVAQTSRDQQWVATWATALVARGQGSGGPGGGAGRRGRGPAGPPPAAGPAATPGGAPAGPPPAGGPRGGGRGGFAPVTVSNQTLRQIVHTSIGGNRVRVVLSNAFGTSYNFV